MNAPMGLVGLEKAGSLASTSTWVSTVATPFWMPRLSISFSMKERYHIDMEAEEQHSKLLSDLPPVDGVITMGCNVACPSVPCAWREDWGLDDPTGQPDDVFWEVIRQIEEKVLQLKERLR